ncbi:MAG: hypothetical protein JWO91_1144 [Acidobacteriaceae bacterium]|nr:hypothetical protein [Acidobacteriaceae bacterium]
MNSLQFGTLPASEWQQAFSEAVVELEPREFAEKLNSALNAIDRRLLELRDVVDGDSVEIISLSDARRTLVFLRDTEARVGELSRSHR